MLTTVNADGTKTLYSYDSPIKYVDEEGYVRFIDSSLKPCGKADGLFDWYSYENTANDVKTYFPLFIGTGVLVESEQGDIRMTPKGSKISMSSKTEEDNTEYVLYEDVFDKDTDIRYTAINEGIKEDIILNAYNGNNTFEYIVEAEGLTPVRDTGKTIEFIDGDLQTAYTFGEIVLFDSADMPATNSNSHYTVDEIGDGKYLVTLVVDEEFLTDEDTVYPVVIDPSVASDTATNCFEHETYAFGEDEGEGIQLFSYIGVSQTGYEFITYMQLTDMSEFVDINPSNINSATFTIYSNEATPSYNVELFAYNFATEKTVDGLSWANIQHADNNPVYSNTQTITNSLTVDISNYFRDWLTVKTKSYTRSYTLSAEDGFFIKAAGSEYSSYQLKPLYMEYVNSNILAPRITVTYTEDVSLETGYYYIQSGYYQDDARYLTASDENGIVIYDYTGAANQIWYVARNDEYTGNSDLYGRYRIYNAGEMDYLCSSGSSVELDHIHNDGLFYDSSFSYKILDQSNGYKRIIPGAYGYTQTLDVEHYRKENNTSVNLRDVKGLDNQRWKFKPVEKLVIPVGSDTKYMVAGERLHLGYSLINGAQLVSLSSNNDHVVTVDNGYLVANSQGTATITAVAKVPNDENNEDLVRATTWTVYVDPQTVTLDKDEIWLMQGQRYLIEKDTNSKNSTVSWYSQNTSIASVDNAGWITAQNIGDTTISATVLGGYSDSCIVHVVDFADTDNDGLYNTLDDSPNSNTVTGDFTSKYSSEELNYSMDFSRFFQSNTTYYQELSQTSILLSSLAYGGDENTFDGKDITDFMVDYLGFEDDIDNIDLKEKDHNDEKYKDHLSQAFVGTRVYAVNGVQKRIFCIVVRGTNGTIEEWSSNFDIGNTNNQATTEDWEKSDNHMGFDIATTRLLKFINDYVEKNTDLAVENVFWITGHSRGAAIANILASRLIDNNETVYAYTFASPNTTTATNANAAKYDSIFNVVNEDDFVPYLPMNQWSFCRYGRTATKSIENNYTQVWNDLFQIEYNSDIEKTKETVSVLSTIATDRNSCYEYKNDNTGYYIEPYSNLPDVVWYPTLIDYWKSEPIVGGYRIYQKPMYFMQVLAIVLGKDKLVLDEIDGVVFFLVEFATYLEEPKNKIIQAYLKGCLKTPHYCESYYVLSTEVSNVDF